MKAGTLTNTIATCLVTVGLCGEARADGPPISTLSRFFPSAASSGDGDSIPLLSLGNSDYCGVCHRDIFQQWAASAHHFSSFNNPFYRRVALDTARRKGDETLKWCAGCHDPIPLLSGQMGRLDLEGWSANAGITCLTCHRIVAVKGGNAAYVLTPPVVHPFALSDRPLLQGLHDRLIRFAPWIHRAALAKPIYQSAEFCAACHSQTIPGEINGAGPFSVQDEYAHWRAGGFSARPDPEEAGRTPSCATCHMPLVPSEDPAAKGGLVRSHGFAAANTALPTLNRDDDHLARVEAFLSSGRVDLELYDPGRNQGPADGALKRGSDVELAVIVRNRGVGHMFPGGTVDSNEAWIELGAIDGAGRSIFESGRRNDRGEADPEAVFYRTVFADRKGRPTDRSNTSSDAAAIRTSRLIPAGGSDQVRYRFTVPDDAESPLWVTARLNWRKFSPVFTRWVFAGREVPDLPVTVVAEDARRIRLAPNPPPTSRRIR